MTKVIGLFFSFELGQLLIQEVLPKTFLGVIPLVLPISAYFTGLYFFHKLQSENNYVTLKSIGISRLSILSPIALTLTVFAFWLAEIDQWQLPAANAKLRLMTNELKSRAFLKEIHPGVFFNKIPRTTFFTEKFNDQTLELNDVFINITSADNSEQKVIFAQSGNFEFLKNSSSPAVGNLVLFEGQIAAWNQTDQTFDSIHFHKFDFPLPFYADSYDIKTKASFLNYDELKSLKRNSSDLLSKGKMDKEKFFQIQIEYYDRFSAPIVFLLLGLLGAILGTQETGRSTGHSKTLFSIFSLIGYFGLYFTFIGLCKKGYLGAEPTIWIPVGILLVYVVYIYRRLQWS